MSGFFSMGGYAAFVWPAYGATVLAIGSLAIASLVRRRALRREIARLTSRDSGA